jgi:hypothetical protein
MSENRVFSVGAYNTSNDLYLSLYGFQIETVVCLKQLPIAFTKAYIIVIKYASARLSVPEFMLRQKP